MFQFGPDSQDSQNSQAVQREQVVKKVKKGFEQDPRLNKEGIMGAAYSPNFYGKGSVSETAKERLNNILQGQPEKKKKYQFGQPQESEGLQYKRILGGEEP